MKLFRSLILSATIISASGCVTKFMPEIDESRELLVVEGMITDQPETNTIRLTKSLPLDKKSSIKPIPGCIVTITDDLNNLWTLKDIGNGYYVTDSLEFRGSVGRTYTLQIHSNGKLPNNYFYESLPMELKPVPPIDDLFWEKEVIEAENEEKMAKEGCTVYLNTRDYSGECQYFRWDYTETWEVRIPYEVTNNLCWATNKSTAILIKNTGILSENIVSRFPVNFISNETDRLEDKYSILVNQYSINEEEYDYWDKMQRMSEQIGSLYDMIPASIQGNIYCVDDPSQKVLGYFSVSAKASRRIFIEDSFSGLVQLYKDCPISPPIPLGTPVPSL
ncbi:MAG: DUF4249 domain-containing protein, partial [Bacteroidia bacterium]|nr:DUF4249 domain-containing protein [Bacteroidia bacterium]